MIKKIEKLFSKVDETWSLFLDRDGTINKRIIGGYVTKWDEFEFLPGALEALPILNSYFGLYFIVTNQQGIGKELMTEDQLWEIHQNMLDEIHMNGGFIHEIYHCPDLAIYEPLCRKPNPGLALEAQKHFPEVNFKKSVMIGDTMSDMEFGKNLGMKTIYLSDGVQNSAVESKNIDVIVPSLIDLAKNLITLSAS